MVTGIDAHEIAPGLWMGSAPPFGRALARAGFSALCLCAYEHQPDRSFFPGIQVLRIDLDDDGSAPPRWQLREAWHLAAHLARRIRSGETALITCAQGRNRSGLVSAMTLCHMTGAPGKIAARAVRERRRSPFGPALTNAEFMATLETIPHKPMPGLVTRQAARQARLTG